MQLQDLQTGEWRKIYLPEASCAFDGDYCFHVRRGDASRLMIYLCGGGVSWDRDSAKWPSTPETAEKYGHVGLYTVCAEGEGGHAVLFQNLSMDPIFDFDILLPKRCRGFRAVGVEGEDRGDRIHVAGEVAPMGCFLLEVEYENGGV